MLDIVSTPICAARGAALLLPVVNRALRTVAPTLQGAQTNHRAGVTAHSHGPSRSWEAREGAESQRYSALARGCNRFPKPAVHRERPCESQKSSRGGRRELNASSSKPSPR